MSTRTLEGWSSHKHLNKQILSLFQRQWEKILGDWCKSLLSWCWLYNAKSSGMMITGETSSVLSWDTWGFNTLTTTQAASEKPFWWETPLAAAKNDLAGKKSPETTLAVDGVARIKPSPANSALPSALVVVMVEILSVPPPRPAVQKGFDPKRFLWHLNISNCFSETKRS